MRKEKISTTSAKSKDTDGDSLEWIAECLECPLDECINCRFAPRAYIQAVDHLRGCLSENVFIRCYNSGEGLYPMARELKVPAKFLEALLIAMKLPYRAADKRPLLTRRMIYKQSERIRDLFG